MSGKCMKCNAEVSASEITAKCVDCKSIFHPACTRAGSVQNFTKNKNKAWKCDSCKEEVNSTASLKSTDRDNEDRSSVLDAISLMKSEIIANLDSKIGNVNASITSLSEGLQDLKKQISSLTVRQDAVEECCDTVKKENKRLTDEVKMLQTNLLDAEQHSRSANLEIVGIPLTQGENVYDILESTARVINVPYREEDISMAHRLRLYSRRHSHPPLIVQFTSRRVREMWLRAVRVKRNLLASELAASFPATNVFVNEHLTPDNKALLGRARRLRREGKLHFAGFVNGKVLVRAREDDDAVRIHCLRDLDKLNK